MNEREIERACERLVSAYARLIDFRDYEGFSELFAGDGELDTGRPAVGPAEIFKHCMRRPETLRSRHLMSNVHIEVLSATEARGMSYVTIYRHVGPESLARGPAPLAPAAAVGHYEDRYRLTPEGWRFARRKLHLAFRDESQTWTPT